MRSRFILFVILFVATGILNFVNANKIVQGTKKLAKLETQYAAVKNINTELKVEMDELRSGKHIASLVRIELSDFVPQQEQGKIIYVHEPADPKARDKYCIIDLFASKAQAKEVQVMLD